MDEQQETPRFNRVAPSSVRALRERKAKAPPASYYLSGVRLSFDGERPTVAVSFHQGHPLALAETGEPAVDVFGRESWGAAENAHGVEIILDLNDPETEALVKELKIGDAVKKVAEALDGLWDALEHEALPRSARIVQ